MGLIVAYFFLMDDLETLDIYLVDELFFILLFTVKIDFKSLFFVEVHSFTLEFSF